MIQDFCIFSVVKTVHLPVFVLLVSHVRAPLNLPPSIHLSYLLVWYAIICHMNVSVVIYYNTFSCIYEHNQYLADDVCFYSANVCVKTAISYSTLDEKNLLWYLYLLCFLFSRNLRVTCNNHNSAFRSWKCELLLSLLIKILGAYFEACLPIITTCIGNNYP